MQLVGDPSRVRLARACDEEDLMALCREFHSEGNAPSRFDECKARASVRQVILSPPEEARGIVGVIGDTGAIEAATCLEMAPLWYTDEWSLVERWAHVRPEHRHSSNIQDLLAFAVRMSDYFSLPLIASQVIGGKTEDVVRHYRRAYGEPVGAYFRYSAPRPL